MTKNIEKQNELNAIKKYINESLEIDFTTLAVNINKSNFGGDDKFLLMEEFLKSKAPVTATNFTKIANDIFKEDEVADKTRCLLILLRDVPLTIGIFKIDRYHSSYINNFIKDFHLEKSDYAKETILAHFIEKIGGSISQKDAETMKKGIGIIINKTVVDTTNKVIGKTDKVAVDEPSEREKKDSKDKVEAWLNTLKSQGGQHNSASQNASEKTTLSKSKSKEVEDIASNPHATPNTSPRPTSFSKAASSGRTSSNGSNGSEFLV